MFRATCSASGYPRALGLADMAAHIPLKWWAPREAFAALVLAGLVAGVLEATLRVCSQAGGLGAHIPTQWGVATCCGSWATFRVLVWRLQCIRPRYFVCPSRPQRVVRQPPSTLASATTVPPAVDFDGQPEAELARALPPGQLIRRDFRPASIRAEAASREWKRARPLRVTTWNVERGIELPDILEELSELQSDVILLQEVDVGCTRSRGVDVGAAIAKEFGMQLLYVTEFVEYGHPSREAHAAGGGVHGNAIVTWLDVDDAWAFQHQWRMYPWSTSGPLLREPRRGARVTMAADIRVPAGALRNNAQPHDEPVLVCCYSVHLENFCGMLGRFLQFGEVLDDVMVHHGRDVPLVIGGDLNTLVIGVTRLLPLLWDAMTFLSVAPEAALWKRIWETPRDATFVPVITRVAMALHGMNPFARTRWHRGADVVLVDPFHVEQDNTVEELGGVWKAKLDWLLYRGLQCIRAMKGGEGASDHLWLSMDVYSQ